MLTGPQLVTLQGDFMRMYRLLLRIPRCDSTSERDAFVLAKVCRPPLPHLFSAMRLRLFGRLLRTGPSYLISLLSFHSESQPTLWLARVRQDLVWLRAFSHDLASYPSPHSHMERWEALALSSPNGWKRRIRNALTAGAQHFARAALADAAAKHFFQVTVPAGVPLPTDHADHPQEQARLKAHYPIELTCPWCPRTFHKFKGLKQHVAQEHWTISQRIKPLIPDVSACPACGMQFGNRASLIQHLCFDAHLCSLFLLCHSQALPLQQVADLASQRKDLAKEQVRAGLGRWRVALPARRAGRRPHPAFPAFTAHLTSSDAKAILAATDYALDDDARRLLFPDVLPPPPAPPLPALPEWPFQPDEYSGDAATPLPARIKRRKFSSSAFFLADAGQAIYRII